MIFLDFDGTIVDLWPRYHRAFCIAAGTDSVRLEDYRRTKRRFPADRDLAEALHIALPADYFSRKRQLLESEPLLKLDTLLLSATALTDFFALRDCRILTGRRQKALFLEELARLGLAQLTEYAIVLDPDVTSKKEYIRTHFPAVPHIVVGDSKAEWETGELENVRVALVRTGLRRPEDFPLTEKHFVVDTLSQFLASYRDI